METIYSSSNEMDVLILKEMLEKLYEANQKKHITDEKCFIETFINFIV